MAEKPVTPKSEKVEKAIARLFGQMDKTVAKRQWSATAYSNLITYVVESHGAKFPDKAARDEFRTIMEDSDFSFSSNFKAYAAKRGLLPAKDEYATATFE
jgi:hypothetical protein